MWGRGIVGNKIVVNSNIPPKIEKYEKEEKYINKKIVIIFVLTVQQSACQHVFENNQKIMSLV